MLRPFEDGFHWEIEEKNVTQRAPRTQRSRRRAQKEHLTKAGEKKSAEFTEKIERLSKRRRSKRNQLKSRSLTPVRKRRDQVPFDCAQGRWDDMRDGELFKLDD